MKQITLKSKTFFSSFQYTSFSVYLSFFLVRKQRALETFTILILNCKCNNCNCNGDDDDGIFCNVLWESPAELS